MAMISPDSRNDNGLLQFSQDFSNDPSFDDHSLSSCSEPIGFDSIENDIRYSLSYESDYTYGLEEPSDEDDLYVGPDQNRVEPTPNSSKIIISSRQESHQRNAFQQNKLEEYERNVVRSPESLKKKNSKNQMSATTLTVSLSSSMSNNSPNSGLTVKLDPNRNVEVQHWNVHDGPFDIAIIKSSDSSREAIEDNSLNLKTQMDVDKSSSYNGNSKRKFSLPREEKSSHTHIRNHAISGRKGNHQSKEMENINNIKRDEIYLNNGNADDESQFNDSYFEEPTHAITDCEIRCYSNHSSVSDIETNHTPVSDNNETIFSFKQKSNFQDEFNQMSPYTSGIHKRYFAKCHDLEQCKLELENIPSLSHSESKSRFTGKGPKNIQTNSMKKILLVWISLVVYSVLFFIQYNGISREGFEPLLGLIPNTPSSVTTAPLIDISEMELISNLDRGKENEYSIIFSNQREGAILFDGITESIDYLVTCKNVKHIHIELNNEVKNTVRATTKNLELLSEKVKIWENLAQSFDFSKVETTTVLLLDEVMGMYNCDDLNRGFRTWTENPDRLVGFDGLNSEGSQTNAYDIVPTSAAFVHIDYLRSIKNHEIFSCEGLGLSILVTAISKAAPIQIKGDKSSYGRDHLLLESRKRREAIMMEDGRKCVRQMMQNFGMDSLPKEEFVYIGTTR